jgi:gamma-glutamyl-gamma-aminobutyrate hydrolase PuuD
VYPGAAGAVDLDRLVSTLDGLVLTGGRDLDPRLYGQQPHPENDEPEPARDELELRLARLAVARDMPVLAICRGFQALNAALGGSLLQHIEGDGHRAFQTDGYPSRFHSLAVTSQGILESALPARLVTVNSRHHQAVTASSIAPTLQITAVSPEDGIVEAYEMPGKRWVLGVQCHPERSEMRELFGGLWRNFVAAAALTRAEPSPSAS